MATMKEIAQICGVSRGTVDRVINRRGKVRPETERMILQAVERMGYTKSMLGRALSVKRSQPVIGVVMCSEGNPFFDDVYAGLARAEEELLPYGVTVERRAMRGYDVDRQLALIDELAPSLSALVLQPVNDPRVEERVQQLKARGVPTVTVNTDLPASSRCCYVGSDYESGGATAAALLGMACVVYMGEEDTRRQALNVYRMRLLGAQVVPVTTGTATLKDAVSEAMRAWTAQVQDTHYCLGSCMGPHPFPTIVRDFQAVISREIKAQMLEREGRLPDVGLACAGGGCNAIGIFSHFMGDPSVRLIGCEAAGRGVDTPETAATIATGRLGIFHGMKSYFCQDQYGQIAPVYSLSAGLDYPGIGPEHAHLHDTGRAQYVPVTDQEAVEAFEYLARTEGIIPAIESAHAVAYARKLAPTMGKEQSIVVTLSGRGDKDCAAIARYRGEDLQDV